MLGILHELIYLIATKTTKDRQIEYNSMKCPAKLDLQISILILLQVYPTPQSRYMLKSTSVGENTLIKYLVHSCML